jgi:hypothetical protein
MNSDALGFLNNVLEGTIFNPFGLHSRAYNVLDEKVFGGKLPYGYDESQIGKPVQMPDGDVKYTTPGYGPQSGESFRKVTGQYPKGFEPAPKEDKKPASTGGQGYGGTAGPYTPPAPPVLTGDKPQDTIKQQQLNEFQQILEEIKKIRDPKTLEAISDIQNRAALERSIVTSALAERQSKERTAREIERENIKAWQAVRVAQTNANATQAAALASAIWASSQMNPNVVGQAFQNALRPITLTGRS